MKTTFRLLLGLLLLIPICDASSATGAPHKALKTDGYMYGFGYTVLPETGNPGVYDIKLYFLQLDTTNWTWSVMNSPEAVTITCSTGPKVGTFTYPSGWSSVPIGNTNGVPGTNYPISTSPTSINGLAIYQEAFEIWM